MTLEKYLKKRGRQAALARAIGVSPGFVYQIKYGKSRATAEQCLLIEEATNGAVRCEELRPDVAWHVLRGKPLPEKGAV